MSNTVMTPNVFPPTTFDGASVHPWTFVVSTLFPSDASLFVASMWEGVTSPPSTLVLYADTFPTSSLQSEVVVLTPSFTEWTTVPLPGVPTPPIVAAALSFALGGSFVVLYFVGLWFVIRVVFRVLFGRGVCQRRVCFLEILFRRGVVARELGTIVSLLFKALNCRDDGRSLKRWFYIFVGRIMSCRFCVFRLSFFRVVPWSMAN